MCDTAKISFDERIESYHGYLPDAWGWAAVAAAAGSAELQRYILDLALDWRTTAYTAAMPANAVRFVQSSLLGYAGHSVSNRGVAALAAEMLDRLDRRVPDVAKSRGLQARLRAAIGRIAAEIRCQTASVQPNVPLGEIWAGFLRADAFPMSLWSSQRVAYVSFYNAYEAFLVRCLKRAMGAGRLRTQAKEFKTTLRSEFGADIYDPCWANADLNLARLVRHALSHNGGRVTEDLMRAGGHGVRVLDGVLQVFPEDNHRLMAVLMKAVDTLISHAAGHKAFAGALDQA